MGAVLAGGAGTRFDGGAKLRAPLRGKPLVVWAIDQALGGGLDAVAVVTGATEVDDLVPPGVAVLRNVQWAQGQATSLAVAVDWAAAGGAGTLVIGLGDQPFVTAGSWRAVAGALGSSGGPAIAVATYDGHRRHPVALTRAVWPLLPRTGDEGARRLMRERPDLVGEVPCAGTAADIDTVEDLERWS